MAFGGAPEGSCFGERAIEKRLGSLARLTPLRGHRLLDLGCGRGNYTTRVADDFDEVHAVDIDAQHIAIFRERLIGSHLAHKISPQVMTGERLDYPDGYFDAVMMIEVLEHVGDADRTLAEVHRVLAPGGRLLLTGPNRFFPLESHGFRLGGRYHPPQHFPFLSWMPPLHARLTNVRMFTRRGVERQAAAHGLRLEAHSYIMPPFDRRGARRLRLVTDALEATPLRIFGISLIAVFRRD